MGEALGTGAWGALAVYFAGMLGIGLYAWRRSRADVGDYLLGGRSLGPGVTALSAGASDMSGWLLMGLPGAVLSEGLGAAWIGIGLTLGAWANYRLVAARLRTFTARANDALTIPDFLAERFGPGSDGLRLTAAIVIILFFTLYASAGMVAGGKFAVAALGLDYATGIMVTGGIVVAYTLLGGFLAVSLTDFVQGTIMLIGLIVVPLVAASVVDGAGGLGPALAAREVAQGLAPGQLTDLLAGLSPIAIVSAAAWGLGYFGQPHIIVRFMGIARVEDLPTARRINLGWMALSLVGAVATGLIGAAWLQAGGAGTQVAAADPETIFIALAKALFVPVATGVFLAAILAAIMSTISAQLLVTASSVAEDVYRPFLRPRASGAELVAVSRAMVLAVALLAAWLARDPEASVLTLVASAWAGFGAAFGPAVLFALRWRGTTRAGVLAGMVTGAVVVIAWSRLPWGPGGAPLSDTLYEIVPGFIAASIAIWAVSRATTPPPPAQLATWDAAIAEAKGY